MTFQEQADRLRDLVARFKIPDAPQAARPRQAAPASASAARTPLPRAEPKPRPLPKRPVKQAVGAEDEWKEF
jgi:hypothetical protein